MFVRTLIAVLFLACFGFVGVRAAEEQPAKDAAAVGKEKAEAEKQLIEKQKASYPLKTCVVAGGELGGMGDPVDFVHEGTLVRFCCKGCIKKFQKDPETYLKKIKAAAKASETEKPKSGDTEKSDAKKSSEVHKPGETPAVAPACCGCGAH